MTHICQGAHAQTQERFLELIQACLETASFVLELQQCVTFRIVQAGADGRVLSACSLSKGLEGDLISISEELDATL